MLNGENGHTQPSFCHSIVQWRNCGLKSERGQAIFLTWCPYKVEVRPHTIKSGGPGPYVPLKSRLCHSALEDRNMDACVNTDKDPSTSDKNLANFVSVKFCRRVRAGRAKRWALPSISSLSFI